MPMLGVNGQVLVYDPNSTWRYWALQEIYLGTPDSGKYVPKVNDFVKDYETGETFKVIFLDITTYIPTLDIVRPVDNTNTVDDYDVILAQGPGGVYDTHRAYLDTSVRPFKLALEHRNFIHGTSARYVKIFRGSVSESSDYRVISVMYDPSGNLLGNDIPLELSNVPNHQNYSTYSIPPCWTLEDMPNGEIITVVVYSDLGHVVSKSKYLIERTSYIRHVSNPVKYVTHISLKSEFISGSDPNTIKFPINVPLHGLNLMGRVHYSDGTFNELPVDGTRFKVFGLSNFVSTIVGREIPVVITYSLAQNEVAYGVSVGDGKHISANYTAKTIEADGQYAVKLYGYPVWVDSVNGYRIEWFLYNLLRQRHYNVTPYVSFNTNTQVYNPVLYGITQRLSVSINLQNVTGTFANYIHTQTIDIGLMQPANGGPTSWTIGFDPGQNPAYGVGNFAQLTFVNQNLKYLDIKSGATNQTEWLEKLYYNTKALINPETESIPPTPTHFSILLGASELEYPISEWSNTFTVDNRVQALDTLFIKFYIKTNDNDIQLSIAGIPVRQVT